MQAVVRVLAGGPARECSSDLYRLHVEGLKAQAFEGVEIDVRHEVVEDNGGPRWYHEKIARVAKARQNFLDCRHSECWCAVVADHERGCGSRAALFLCDSDVICGPGVLKRLMEVDADVVHAVYWTRDSWGQPVTSDVAPQVWWTSPYRWDPQDIGAMTCWNALCEPGVNEVQVNGGGACTLIRGRGFESHYWPLIESLKGAGSIWYGEDRTFCLGLEHRGIRQVAVTGLPVVHLYHESLHTPAKLAEARKLVGLDARTETASV